MRKLFFTIFGTSIAIMSGYEKEPDLKKLEKSETKNLFLSQHETTSGGGGGGGSQHTCKRLCPPIFVNRGSNV